jgi:hypothetical protein
LLHMEFSSGWAFLKPRIESHSALLDPSSVVVTNIGSSAKSVLSTNLFESSKIANMYTNNSPQGNAAYGGQQQQGGGMYSQQGGNAGNMGNMQQQQGQQGQPAMRHGGGQQQQQQQQQNQSMLGSDQADMMLNFGMNQGSAMLKQQQEKWMPGVSGFWQSLKIYFAVNNVYVVKKLSMILYPLGVKSSQSWIRKNAEDGGYDVSPTTHSLLCFTTLHLSYFPSLLLIITIIPSKPAVPDHQ